MFKFYTWNSRQVCSGLIACWELQIEQFRYLSAEAAASEACLLQVCFVLFRQSRRATGVWRAMPRKM